MKTQSESRSTSDAASSGSIFQLWQLGSNLLPKDRLSIEHVDFNDDSLQIRVSLLNGTPIAAISSDSHLTVRFTSESVNFMDFSDLDLSEGRIWVSDSSDWIQQVIAKSGHVYDGVRLRHFLVVLSDATIEFICLTDPAVALVGLD
jgi:hypothetical protein